MILFNEKDLGQSDLMGSLLNEKYFGKQGELIECEKMLDEILAAMAGNYAMLPTNTKMQEKFRRIEKILAELFNFSEVVLDTGWITTGVAYTIPAYSVLDNMYEISVTNRGYRYDKPYFPCVIRLDKDVFTMAKSGAEVLGIILHEIGHNFYYMSLYGQCLQSCIYFSALVSKYSIYFNNKLTFGFMRPVFEYLENDKGLIGQIFEIFNIITRFLAMNGDTLPFLKLLDIVNKIASFSRQIPAAVLGLNQLVLTFGEGYSNEKFADDFATVYGYGADMNNILLRLHVPNGSTGDGGFDFVQFFGETLSAALTLPTLAVDVHPAVGARIENSIKRLRKDLSVTKNVRAKALIHADIKKVEESLQRYEQFVKDKKILDLRDLEKHVKDPLLTFARTGDEMSRFDDHKVKNPKLLPAK
jgi:hypothetical protein